MKASAQRSLSSWPRTNWEVVVLRLFGAVLLVSGQLYIGNMRVNPDNQASSAPVFIEVPKPVNLITPSEKDEFIEEILKALEGK
jgi:hypothetical protein